MKEIKVNMENLSDEERKQLLTLVEKANKPSKVWKPEENESYYYIDNAGDIMNDVFESRYDCDKQRYSIGNSFKTEEEASFMLEKFKIITELNRFAEEHNDPKHTSDLYTLCYDTKDDTISFTWSTPNYRFGGLTPRFTSEAVFRDAIKTIGEDRIKKYYFGII